jgi:SAM-dependent methyltransferase
VNIACAFCDSTALREIVNFGNVALAGAFLKPEQFAAERTYPLRLFFCSDCLAVQLVDKVQADVLFRDYFYFSSAIGTLRDHFRRYAEEVTTRFLSSSHATVLEFGCNDGVLLRPLADAGIRTVIGVDPATNVVQTIDDPRITVVNDFFNEPVGEQIVAAHGKADLIMANNVYAHIPDIQGTTRTVSSVLKDDGVFVFEVHYLGKVIDELQYDMIYHEHLYYYSLLSAMNHFDRHDMVVFDVKPVPIHAGSMRFYVCKKGGKHASTVSADVVALREAELSRGYDRYETFRRFSECMADHREKLVGLLRRLREQRCSIAGYGASGRANALIQYCGIRNEHLDFMIDDAPAKIGFFTPGSHFRIFPSSKLADPNPPDYLLIFAWSFFEEIRKRNAGYLERGGRMILPLPEVTIYPSGPQDAAVLSNPLGAAK